MNGKKHAAPEPCPCESGGAYAECCEPFHLGAAAPTPEALMRSRYSAYAKRLTLYLVATWHPGTRPLPEALDLGDRRTKWLGLKILRTAWEGEEGIVEFVARFREGGGRAVRLHEASRFVRENGRWLYVDGVMNA